MEKDKGQSLISKGYLIAYNVFQFLGWTIIFIQTIHHLLSNGFAVQGLWEETNCCLKIFQSLAILEVVHVVIGLVKSSAMTTLIQISSRLFVTWAICASFKPPQQNYGLVLILIAWSVTEMIRYSFYFLNIIKQAPYGLIYLRYTLFIVLYPMGVLGEQWCILVAMPEILEKKSFSYTMPNPLNFTFSFYYVCIIVLFMYLPFFPQLYLHMFSQRGKALGGKSAKKVSNKKIN